MAEPVNDQMAGYRAWLHKAIDAACDRAVELEVLTEHKTRVLTPEEATQHEWAELVLTGEHEFTVRWKDAKESTRA